MLLIKNEEKKALLNKGLFIFCMKVSINKEKFFIHSLLWAFIMSVVFYFIFYIFLFGKIDDLIKHTATTIYDYGVSFSVAIVFFTIIFGFVLHEFIHGVFSIFFTKDIKAVRFGIMPKQMMFYCHCKKPLYVNNYLTMVIAPFIIMGLIPFASGLYFENLFAIFFGYIFSVAAIGDLYIIYLVLKNYQKKYIKDSETEIGGNYIDI